MTVTLAFKAFAKAIPSLTPFLATSDPSVLKRILAYIRGLPCSSNISLKSDPCLYDGPIVAVRLSAFMASDVLTGLRALEAVYCGFISLRGDAAMERSPLRVRNSNIMSGDTYIFRWDRHGRKGQPCLVL